MNIKRSIIRIPDGLMSAVVYLFATVFTRGLTVITTPIFVRLMTTEQIGVVNLYSSWYSMITVVSTLALTSGGFSIALREFEKERDQYVSSILSLTTIIALIIGGIYFIAPSFWNNITGLPSYLMCLLLMGLIVAPARDFWFARQRFEYKYKLSGCITVLSAIMASGLSVIAVIIASSHGNIDIAGVRLISNYTVIYGVALIIWISIMLKGKCFFSARFWKFSLSLSLPLVGYSIASQILNVSDRLMISKMIGNSAVGIYSTLYTVSSLSLMVWTAINASFVPYLYQNIENVYNSIRKISLLILMLYSSITIFIIYLAPEIVKILATEEYYEGIYIMPPIAGGVYFTAVSNLYSDILVYLKKTKLIMIASLIAAGLNIVLNYVMIKKFGYMAAAYTTLVSYIVMAILLALWANREFKMCMTGLTFTFDNKKILLISLITLILSFLALILYNHFVIRYVFIIILLGGVVVLGTIFLKAKKVCK